MKTLKETIKSIHSATNADDPASYRSDDREGCLDFVHSECENALKLIEQRPVLVEVVADIAYIAGRAAYHSGDSRKDLTDFISWALEFIFIHRNTNWEDNANDYLEEVEKMAKEKMSL